MIHWIDGIELSWWQNAPQWIDTIAPRTDGREYATPQTDHTKDDEKIILDFIVFFTENYLRG